MQTVTSFPATSVGQDQLGGILKNYLLLDRMRLFRRRLFKRFGMLALIVAGIGGAVQGFSTFARLLTSALCLVPPAWAWIAELRLEGRLSRLLDGVDGVITQQLVAADPSPGDEP